MLKRLIVAIVAMFVLLPNAHAELKVDIVAGGGMKESYIEQVREMCSLLYHNNLNIDYYPTNFIPQEDVLYYIDYECNVYSDEWNFENWGIKYWRNQANSTNS